MSAFERFAPRPVHLARLMAVWRSAGWPCRDGIELDLMAAGWVRPIADAQGRESLQITTEGMEALQQARRRRIRSASLHDRLAARMCQELQRQGRIVWRELSLRAPIADGGSSPQPSQRPAVLPGMAVDDVPLRFEGSKWRLARPDLYSIRHTTLEAALHPIVHEIKASRADLLADLRDCAKGEAYRSVSCETYYVAPTKIADVADIPTDFGIWTLDGTPEEGTLTLARPARYVHRPPTFALWMALARATPVHDIDEPAQAPLAVTNDDRDG